MIAQILIIAMSNAFTVSPAESNANGFHPSSILEGSMTKTLGPNWSADQIASGRKFADGWRKYAATEAAPSLAEDRAKVADVLARYEAELMRYPHVVAVADGICRDDDGSASAECIVVYVANKVSQEELSEEKRFPDEIEGVRIEVVEAGQIDALPLE